MTFQEKYAKKREEAQKVLEDALKQINVDDCANAIFEATCKEFDEKITEEYNGERIKKLDREYLADTFSVPVNFCISTIEVSGKEIGSYHDALLRKSKLIEVLTEKLREVGIDFEPPGRVTGEYNAKLVFKKPNDNNSDS